MLRLLWRRAQMMEVKAPFVAMLTGGGGSAPKPALVVGRENNDRELARVQQPQLSMQACVCGGLARS